MAPWSGIAGMVSRAAAGVLLHGGWGRGPADKDHSGSGTGSTLLVADLPGMSDSQMREPHTAESLNIIRNGVEACYLVERHIIPSASLAGSWALGWRHDTVNVAK